MSTTKNITCQYFRIEAAETDYFHKLYKTLTMCLNPEYEHAEPLGSFEAGDFAYAWELRECVNVGDLPCFLFTIAKERKLWPSWVTEDQIIELSLNGKLGDIHYCLVCPAKQFVIVCGSAGSVKRMLGQFSSEGIVRLTPFFEEQIDEKVLSWDCYKKVSFSFNMPSGEDVTEFANTKAGGLGYLGGLKADITVSAGGKEMLSNMMVKDILPELLEDDLCKSLIVRGSDFENGSQEQYDLKNAQVKYKEQLGVEGNYIMVSEMKQVFMRALNERAKMLGVDKYDLL